VVAILVYVLCATTALACAILLGRNYKELPNNLLFWGVACFVGLTVSNIMLVVDLIVSSQHLSLYRDVVTFVSGAGLLYGIVTEITS
jgi:hypothetical protein